jgi:hypothetical protein
MEHLAAMLWHFGDAPDLPDSFWAGLQAAWFTARSASVIGPLLEAVCSASDGPGGKWLLPFAS